MKKILPVTLHISPAIFIFGLMIPLCLNFAPMANAKTTAGTYHCGQLIIGENDGYAKFKDWGVPGQAEILVAFHSADNDEEPLATQVARLFRVRNGLGHADPEKIKNGILVKMKISSELVEAVQFNGTNSISRKHIHLVDAVQPIDKSECKRVTENNN